MADSRFKGPGHWRSQAEKARGLDGNVFAELAEMHRRLVDKGLTEVAARVAEAQEKARDGFTDAASDILREAAAAALAAEQPAHAHAQGLREIAERTAAVRSGTTRYAAEDELPGGPLPVHQE